ncbi:putative uncharacterized protein [Firmicutes bacterium CAG:103]|nr:putative uncharacterized protein [Firmicutes bacterium CAG:103]
MDAIVAVYADWGIGAKGTQPLVIPADRRRFRELTMGAAVIVGRRTLDDFPCGRPPPSGRQAAAGARKPRAHAAEHRDRGRAGGALPGGGRGRRRAV